MNFKYLYGCAMNNLDVICKCAKYIVNYDTYRIDDSMVNLYYDGLKVGCIHINPHGTPAREIKRTLNGNTEIRISEQFKTFIKLWGDVNAMPDIGYIMVIPYVGNCWYISTIDDKLEFVFIAWLYTNALVNKGRNKKKYYIGLM